MSQDNSRIPIKAPATLEDAKRAAIECLEAYVAITRAASPILQAAARSFALRGVSRKNLCPTMLMLPHVNLTLRDSAMGKRCPKIVSGAW